MNKIWLAIALLVTACIAIKPTERIEFTAADCYPEGIAYDKVRDLFLVSSMRDGTIGKVTSTGHYTPLYKDSTLKSTYGMKVHPDGKRLFVCVGDANYSKYTSARTTRRKMIRLISIDMATGNKLTDVDLSNLISDRQHFANDLTFDDQGNIFITDSYAHAVYRVTADGSASVFATSKLFETEGIGINGIVYHPRGFLLVDNSNTGRLYKIDSHDPAKVSRIEIDQYFLGADGMILKDENTLVMVVNGGNDKIFEIRTEDNWQSATLAKTTLTADRFTYPATATQKGDDVWVINARTNELMDSTAYPSKRFAIQKAVLKPIPKKLR
jgi:sugar lactone lactonase YvrE